MPSEYNRVGVVVAVAVLCCCLPSPATALSGSVRLPMEVFGANSTEDSTNATSIETRKAVLRQKVLLLNAYAASDAQTAGSGIEETLEGVRRPEAVHGARILYQIGSSEADLPICAPNAVCSKIDLYETPWIERQCRCPKLAGSAKHPHNALTINHPKEPLSGKQSSSSSSSIVSDAYHQFLEQQRRKMAQMAAGSDYTNTYDLPDDDPHVRSVLRKLGVLYNQDDIVMGNENEYDSVSGYRKAATASASGSQNGGFHDTKRMRHSVHRMDVQRMGGCPNSITTEDGHTLADKTRFYKLCEPVHKLPQCRYFKDWVWTLKTSPEMNVTEQIVHCRCPKGAVTYLIRREPLPTGVGYAYLFACSPQSRLRCQRKEPCKLFTVRKRQEFLDEVNTNPLCQCPRNHHCPSHHMDAGVLVGKSYIEDNIRTYSGFCMPDERKSSHKTRK